MKALDWEDTKLLIEEQLKQYSRTRENKAFVQKRNAELVQSMIQSEKTVDYKCNVKPSDEKLFETIILLKMAHKPIFLISEDYEI